MDYSRRQEKTKPKKALKFWSFFLLIVLCMGLAAWFYLNTSSKPEISYEEATKRETTVVAAEQTFTTPYFSFSVTDDWQLVEQGTTVDKVYLYSQFKFGRKARHLKIYVNPTNTRYQVPYIVPVSVIGDRLSVESRISEHCRQQGIDDFSVGERVTIQDGVEFLCDVDSTKNIVSAGVIGGGYEIVNTGADGQTYSLIIEYNDVTIARNDTIFLNILKSFRLK